MKISLSCPDFSVLSKRLGELDITVPRYKKTDDGIHAIAINSTGLKRFGRGEWHQKKYEQSSKVSWRKLHLAINYQRTFGNAMHARDFVRQQQEAMLASGALNKMTSLGMPKSRRSA